MMLVGDLGGFNSAVYLLPNFLMGFISQLIFKWAVASAFPVKVIKNKRELQYEKPSQLLQKLH